ncbi:MAG: DUF4157 domain-containing protein [Candidatus Nanopelagicales bacterium]
MREHEAQRALTAEAVAATRDAGQRLPTDVAADLGRRFSHDFGDVAVHADPQAARAAQRLRAQAFTVGRHIVFGAGRYDPQSVPGRQLLVHEAAHVVQSVPRQPVGLSQPGQAAEVQAVAAASGMTPALTVAPALVHRAVVNDALGNPVSFEFRAGVELRLSFMQLAKNLLGGGVLHTRGLRALRADALNSHGTVDDHERMFMAGLTVAANATTLAATPLNATASVTFPLATITPNMVTVEDLGRETVPATVTAPMARARAALASLEVGQVIAELSTADAAARREIVSRAGSYRDTAEDVIDWAADHRVSVPDVLTAMLAAASDSSPGDRVLAAMVYTIAQAAGMPEAGEVLAGRIKVDALIPSAFASLPGAATMVAFYATVAQASGAKGDTIYVQTTLDIYDLSDRSNVVHELTHAHDDRAAAGATVTFTDTGQLEARAYRAQGRYLLTELAATSTTDRPAILSTLAGRIGALALWGMLVETLSDRTRFEPLVAGLAAAGSPPVPAATVAALLNRGRTALETQLLAQITTAYRLTAGQQSPVDGLAGASLVNWIFRL